MIKVDKRVNRVLLLGAALVPFGVAVAEEGSRRKIGRASCRERV